MLGMEQARADFEAKALLVGQEVEAMRQRVIAANATLHCEREKAAAETRKQRRLSGKSTRWHDDQTAGNPDQPAERAFDDHTTSVEEQLQAARRAIADRRCGPRAAARTRPSRAS